jgi:hypothetical protein
VSQPPPYNRSFSFSSFQAQNPTGVPPGSSIDHELNNVKSSIDGIESNLVRIQRDDGALANGSVTYDTLSPALQTAGIAPALPWVTGKAYSVGASSTHGSAFYRALVAHTSGVFATDLAAGNWILIVDFSTIALVAASMIAVTSSGSLTTDVQTSLQALDTGKSALNHTQLASTISDSTAAGRALLTAADATAQNVLLGTNLLGFQTGGIQETAALVLPTGWYYCDGSAKNRSTDSNLFNALTIQQTGVLNSTAVVTGLSDTTNGGNTPMSPGMPVSGTGIPASTVIQSVDSSTQVTLSQAATLSATTALVFAPYGVGDGSSTFNLPNRAYIGVGRDNASGSASNINQVSTTLTLVSGSATGTVGSAAGLFVGMFVAHPKVPYGTRITAISGTTITMEHNVTGSVSGSAARFSPIVDAQTLGAVGGGLTTSTTLVVGNLPPITSVNAAQNIVITSASAGFTVSATGSLAAQSGSGLSNVPINANVGAALSGINSISVVSSNTPFKTETVQPTIVMNYIIKR